MSLETKFGRQLLQCTATRGQRMPKYYGFRSKRFMRRLVAWLNSDEMRSIETDNPVSAEQQRLLTFGAVLFTQNVESCRTLKIRVDKSNVREMLASGWGIRDREEALPVVKYLSNATGHTPFADDVYKALIFKGRLEPLNLEDLPDLTEFESALKKTLDRAFDFEDAPLRNALIDEGYTENELFQVKSIIARDLGLEASSSYMEDALDITEPENDLQSTFGHAFDSEEPPTEMKDEEIELVREIILSEFAGRVNKGIEAYKTTRDILLDLGYTEDELIQVKSTAAWDFGRAVSIARYCVNLGYIEENEAWELMQTAADNAARLYDGWREYLAGYVLGRALGYGSDSTDIYVELRYLLNQENSPFSEASFNK